VADSFCAMDPVTSAERSSSGDLLGTSKSAESLSSRHLLLFPFGTIDHLVRASHTSLGQVTMVAFSLARSRIEAVQRMKLLSCDTSAIMLRDGSKRLARQ
jgi:hypothetical protein